MRKLPFLVVLVLGCAGLAWALMPGLFPDTPTFPRIPTQEGTIGAVLQKILQNPNLDDPGQNGTVKNTTLLMGRSGTGYLKNTLCGNISEGWVGIDAQGKALCGSISNTPSEYARIESQSCPATLYHGSGTTSSTTTGGPLWTGDILRTPPGCSVSIVFSDLSIMHVGPDSVVSLETIPLPSGMTIAGAILQNGSLWGRILSETGSYSIGTPGIVAGVRGTSIAIEKLGFLPTPIWDSTNQKWTLATPTSGSITFSVWDSIHPSPEISASIYCNGNLVGSLPVGKSLTIPGGGLCPTSFGSPEPLGKSALLSSRPWYRESLRKDFIHMTDNVRKASTPTTRQSRIDKELIASLPTNIGECSPVLTGTDISTKCNALFATTAPAEKYFIMGCGATGLTFWPGLLESIGGLSDFCQPDGLIAFVDYTQGSTDLITRSGNIPKGLDWKNPDTILQDDGLFQNVLGVNATYSLSSLLEAGSSIAIGGGAADHIRNIFQSYAADPFPGYDFITIRGAGSYNGSAGMGRWTRWKYGEVFYSYDDSDPNQPPNITPTPDGLKLVNTNDFIAYPLSKLPDLRGKYITIEFERELGTLQPLVSYYFLDLGTLSFFVKNEGGAVRLYQNHIEYTGDPLDPTTFNILAPTSLEAQVTASSIRLKIPENYPFGVDGSSVQELIIGNRRTANMYYLTNGLDRFSFTQPFPLAIKSLSISK